MEKAGNLNCLFNSEFPPRSTEWQQNGINSIHIKNSWCSPLLKVYRRFAFSNRSTSCGSDSLQCIHYNILQSCNFGSCILSRESMPFLKHFLNSFDVASGIHEFIKYLVMHNSIISTNCHKIGPTNFRYMDFLNSIGLQSVNASEFRSRTL